LEKLIYIDFFDSFGTEIYIDFFELKIKRISAKINKNLGLLWITDRIRFFYDMLQIQKINNCYINLYNKYKIFSWYGVYLYFKYIKIFNLKIFHIVNFFTLSIYYFLHTNVDLYSLIFLKTYFFTFNFFEVVAISIFDNFYLNIDLVTNYFFYNNVITFNLINTYSKIFLFGYNIRCEHPVLYLKLLNLIKKKKLKLYIFGISYIGFIISGISYIGLSFKDFYYFFFKFFKFKENSLILIGSALLSRVDFYKFYNFYNFFFLLIAKYLKNFKFIYIYFYLLDLNLIFLGLKKDFRNLVINYKLFSDVYFYTSFNFFFFENDCYYNTLLVTKKSIRFYNNFFMSDYSLNLFIFIGSNFFSYTQIYNLVIPCLFFFERENLILTFFGIFNKLKFIFSPAILVKDIINFYNLFFNLFTFNKFFFYKYLKYKLYISKYFYWFYLFTNKYLQLIFIKKFYFFKLNIFNLELNFFFCFFDFFNTFFLFIINNFLITNLYTLLSKNLLLGTKINEMKFLYKSY